MQPERPFAGLYSRAAMHMLETLLLAFFLARAPAARAQAAPAPSAAHPRIFSEVGPGFRAIRHDSAGRYYVLVAPGSAVLVFDSAGKQLGRVPSQASGASAIVFGAAFDMDAAGRLYVADRGGNAVLVYGADGTVLARVPVAAPTAVAALPEGEFAVSSLNSDHLISVYDFQGTLLRELGNPEDLTDDPALNHRLNLGALASDAAGNLYYAFAFLPEPTVRKYDRFGYLADVISVAVPDAEATAQAARREIARAAAGTAISPRQILSALAVDPSTQDLWVAAGDLVLHCDPTGRAIASDPARTATGARFVPAFILVESNRLLLGNDPLGIYEAQR